MNALAESTFTASLDRIQHGGAAAVEPSADSLRTRFAAVVFDMDGVVTDTAAVHASAWKSLFDALLADERLMALETDGEIDRSPFDIARDYRDFVMGAAARTGSAPCWPPAARTSRRAPTTTSRAPGASRARRR